MLYFYVSNRTENLLQMLGEVLRLDRQADLFAPELFLIQSRGMERMIAQTLADTFSCFCNFRFFLPLDCVAFFAEKFGHTVSPDGFDRATLTWRLEGLLRELTGPGMEPLSRYLAGDAGGVKRFQLARKIANLFDQYQIMRADMLGAWAENRTLTENPAEIWQRELWLRLLADAPELGHRGAILEKLIGQLAGERSRAIALPKRISVFGLHSMPPLFLQFINGLSRYIDVHFYLLSPCEQYWGDMSSRRRLLDTFDELPLAGEGENSHPLLAALGRQGREFQQMLLDLADIYQEFKAYDDPLAPSGQDEPPLLHRVQSDLLHGTVAGQAGQTGAGGTRPDPSIRIVSCYSRVRELQILKDYLLDLLYYDPRLELREIVVMAPDIKQYSALIPAVFGDIQHSIADRAMRGRNLAIGAFVSFLELLDSRFGWSEVMDFLRLPVVSSGLGFVSEDIETLEKWVVESGIRWGLSAEQRQRRGASSFGEVSWRAGLQRMMMGFAIDSDGEIDGILPYGAIEGKSAVAMGGLLRFFDLLERSAEEIENSHSLAGWSSVFLAWSEALFDQLGDSDVMELRAMLADQVDNISRFHERELSFAVVRMWFTQRVGESGSASGFLRGQLTFCSMLPMRSIPFRVVCLIGLDDGVFPKNESRDSFDLMAETYRYGDRSARADDRYQFLEAILAARNNIYLSYVGQSMVNHEKIPPSVVVAEFLGLLRTVYGIVDPVVHHPLHPFSRKYFDQPAVAGLRSYNQYYCRTAQALAEGPLPARQWWQGQLDPPEATVPLSQLLQFYRNPQKYFVLNRLGIRLNQAEEVVDDRELFAVSRLDQFLLQEQLYAEAQRNGRHVDRQTIQQSGLWPLGTPGEILYEEEESFSREMLARVTALGLGSPVPVQLVDLQVGPYRLTGSLEHLCENGVLLFRSGTIRGQDVLRAWIHHLVLGALRGPGQGKTALVGEDAVWLFTREAPAGALEKCLDHFAAGCREPSPVFVELAMKYVATLESGRSSPLAAVHKLLVDILEKRRQPEWELLFGFDPARYIDQRFVEYCEHEFVEIWRAGKGDSAQ